MIDGRDLKASEPESQAVNNTFYIAKTIPKLKGGKVIRHLYTSPKD